MDWDYLEEKIIKMFWNLKVGGWVLCISASFRCCVHPKAGQNTFFEPTSTFFVHFKPFSVISHLKSRNYVWKKSIFFSFLTTHKSWLTCKRWLTPWGSTLNLSFWGSFLSILTSFWVHPAPKKWSKYTTFEPSYISMFDLKNWPIVLKRFWCSNSARQITQPVLTPALLA